MTHLKQQKSFGFLLVLHWAVDVIEIIYYIHGPVEYYRIIQMIFAVLDVSLNNGP